MNNKKHNLHNKNTTWLKICINKNVWNVDNVTMCDHLAKIPLIVTTIDA